MGVLFFFTLIMTQRRDDLNWYTNKLIELPKDWLQSKQEDPIDVIKALCGELCDLSKEIPKENFIGTLRAKVD